MNVMTRIYHRSFGTGPGPVPPATEDSCGLKKPFPQRGRELLRPRELLEGAE
jgi:hypothetical protein